MFSGRVPPNREPNRLARAVAAARASGREVLDLTATNPTTVGLAYPAALLQPLASAAALRYEPEPLGLRRAREAVSADYARRGIRIATDRIVLTASTSEAYSLLFKLLCGPGGDQVLVPVPSYPLFEHLTRLDGVTPVPYRLEFHRRWALDAGSIGEAWTQNVRALLAVSPNNPTGSLLSPAELSAIDAFCADRDAAVIVDEVFADYPLDGAPPHASNSAAGALTFRLGGLSKSAGLPQVKLGWIAVDGRDPLVGEAMDRLELICDTYLSVATPVQAAAPDLIAAGAAVRQQILDRVRSNYRALIDLAARVPSIQLLPAEAGWSAVLRIPSTRPEEDVVLDLLERDGVLVHPGFFFDFPHEAFLVVSLLPAPDTFAAGVRTVMERAGG
jgi:aspartate/methionine/tyrosine aminotransferase